MYVGIVQIPNDQGENVISRRRENKKERKKRRKFSSKLLNMLKKIDSHQ